MKNFDQRTIAPRIQACMIGVWLALLAASAPAQSWFFNWDGTTDITCVPTVEGNNAYFQGGAATGSFSWEIADNGSGGKAFRQVVTSGTGFRWYGYGSRPEFYRGPCNTFAMENFRPDHNAFTIAFRIKAESCSSTTMNRFFNCEFETTVLDPFWTGTPDAPAYGPYYGFRVEFALANDASGNIWLRDFRKGDNLAVLKSNGVAAVWHTVWATCELPPSPYATFESIYRIWIDGVEVPWTDRDRSGWSDCEVGWTPNSGRNATFQLDYLCYAYGANLPGTISIPTERAAAAINGITALKAYADGTPCSLTNKVVTGILTNSLGMRFYYIGETNGTDGIKVSHNTGKSPANTGGSAVALAVGDLVSVKGGLSSAECEKQISAHEIIRSSSGNILPAPATVSPADLVLSYNAALYAQSPTLLLATAVTGIVTSITGTNQITDAGKNWASNQWKNATLFLPATVNHPSLYYYVLANTSNTLTIAHRTIRADFNVAPDIVADGVHTGDAYEFAGGRPTGTRLDGRRLRVIGTVTATNATAGYFDVSANGAGGEIRTLQDIWDRINSGGVWTPPAGLRVKWKGVMPTLGARLSVKGTAGAERFKHQVSTTINGSARDEVKVDKVYPLLAADSFVPFTDPLFTSAALTATGFLANVSVIPGEPYRLRASTDFQTWTDLTNFVAAAPSQLLLDPAATNQPLRFYRVESP